GRVRRIDGLLVGLVGVQELLGRLLVVELGQAEHGVRRPALVVRVGAQESLELRAYPNDKRWTPDAMFRLAELYYEKSAEEFLDADEAYKKAIDSPNPPTTPPPRVDYSPTIALYKR